MKQKVIKFEIGKIFAVVLTVIVVAFFATMALQGGYFKGKLVDKQVVIGDETFTQLENEAFINMRQNVYTGLGSWDVVDFWARKARERFSEEDRRILVANVEEYFVGKHGPDSIAFDLFPRDILKVKRGELKFIHSTEVKLVKEIDFSVSRILIEAIILQKKAVSDARPFLERWLQEALSVDRHRAALEALKPIFDDYYRDIESGVPYYQAFNNRFMALTPKALGLPEKFDLQAIVSKFQDEVGRTTEKSSEEIIVRVLDEFAVALDGIKLAAHPDELAALAAFQAVHREALMPIFAAALQGAAGWPTDLADFAQRSGILWKPPKN